MGGGVFWVVGGEWTIYMSEGGGGVVRGIFWVGGGGWTFIMGESGWVGVVGGIFWVDLVRVDLSFYIYLSTKCFWLYFLQFIYTYSQFSNRYC